VCFRLQWKNDVESFFFGGSFRKENIRPAFRKLNRTGPFFFGKEGGYRGSKGAVL
jgi:hypothetical protein